jgi:hypothetical protein
MILKERGVARRRLKEAALEPGLNDFQQGAAVSMAFSQGSERSQYSQDCRTTRTEGPNNKHPFTVARCRPRQAPRTLDTSRIRFLSTMKRSIWSKYCLFSNDLLSLAELPVVVSVGRAQYHAATITPELRVRGCSSIYNLPDSGARRESCTKREANHFW